MQPSNPNAQPTSIFGTAQASNWSNPFGGQVSAVVAQQTQTVAPQTSAPPQQVPAPFNNGPQTGGSVVSTFGVQVSASVPGHTQTTALQTSAPTQPQPRPTRASNTIAAAPSIRQTQAVPTNALSNPFSRTTHTASSVPVAAQAVPGMFVSAICIGHLLIPHYPASKRALGLSDLLVCIFSEADQKALAAAARVNRQWSLYALDRLWRNLKTVVPLLEILAPLVNSAVPGTSAWTRLTQWVSLILYLQ
ncbi:hypothetical protein FRC02_001089 [Tulasnella sp. 418]|nr:hypothetical protein FRC02_001089 [Tulasnella sp. 418]